MTRKRWTIKNKMVMESLTTAGTADIYKRSVFPPNTFCPWRETFPEGGRAALA